MSKKLAQLNSYIGKVENAEKELRMNRVTWFTMLGSGLFFLALWLFFSPVEEPLVQDPQLSSPVSQAKDLVLVDTLVVFAETDSPPLHQVISTSSSTPQKKTHGTAPSHVISEKEVAPSKAQKKESPQPIQPNLLVENRVLEANITRSSSPTRKLPEDFDPSTPSWTPDIGPKFPGGRAALAMFIQQNVTYPQVESEARKEGTVYIRFIIKENGHMQDPKIIRGLGEPYDTEALKLIEKMPSWIPGKINDQDVATYKDLGIMFKRY